MFRMQSSNLFWPSDRKLFRHRSRARFLVPVIVVVALLFVAIAVGHSGMS